MIASREDRNGSGVRHETMAEASACSLRIGSRQWLRHIVSAHIFTRSGMQSERDLL
jgi:hypothetical protein